MKITKTAIYEQVLVPNSFIDLLKHLSTPHPKWNDRTWMWRGQSDISWPVHSAAFRRLFPTNRNIKDEDIFNYEKDLLEQATHKGFRSIDGCLISDIELLARLQHHGAATRLIDFTRNMLIALWFACFYEPQKTGLLLGFHTAHIVGYEGEMDCRNYKEIHGWALDVDNPITWEPTSVSKRIAAQHSQFVYSRISTDVTGSLWFPKSEDSKKIIALSPSFKKETVKILEQLFDIRYHTIFPDLDGFGGANSHTMPKGYMHRW